MAEVRVSETLCEAEESESDFLSSLQSCPDLKWMICRDGRVWLIKGCLISLVGSPRAAGGKHKAVPVLLSCCKGGSRVQELMDTRLLSPALPALGGLRWQLDGLENRLR